MLTASRALGLHATAAPELPRVEAFRQLYSMGVRPRQGEVAMVVGRSGSQKSGLALFWVAQMGLPTLYLSGDMSAFQASVRVACSVLGETTEQVVAGMENSETRQHYLDAAASVPITFSFGKPITWAGIDAELDAWVEIHNEYPRVIVVDNLMDVQDCSSDYAPQMEAMDNLSELARETGATVIVLHHASDKSWEAKSDPWKPPSRDQVKNGMSEKPELCLSVALDPQSHYFRIACLKQRMGPSDPSAQTYATLRADPGRTRFHADTLYPTI